MVVSSVAVAVVNAVVFVVIIVSSVDVAVVDAVVVVAIVVSSVAVASVNDVVFVVIVVFSNVVAVVNAAVFVVIVSSVAVASVNAVVFVVIVVTLQLWTLLSLSPSLYPSVAVAVVNCVLSSLYSPHVFVVFSIAVACERSLCHHCTSPLLQLLSSVAVVRCCLCPSL